MTMNLPPKAMPDVMRTKERLAHLARELAEEGVDSRNVAMAAMDFAAFMLGRTTLPERREAILRVCMGWLEREFAKPMSDDTQQVLRALNELDREALSRAAEPPPQ